jgi:hypothetical protein
VRKYFLNVSISSVLWRLCKLFKQFLNLAHVATLYINVATLQAYIIDTT